MSLEKINLRINYENLETLAESSLFSLTTTHLAQAVNMNVSRGFLVLGMVATVPRHKSQWEGASIRFKYGSGLQ